MVAAICYATPLTLSSFGHALPIFALANHYHSVIALLQSTELYLYTHHIYYPLSFCRVHRPHFQLHAVPARESAGWAVSYELKPLRPVRVGGRSSGYCLDIH
jgi:fumarate reductase subunit D